MRGRGAEVSKTLFCDYILEHNRNENFIAMIIGELKRCADEIASSDLNFQTIWDMIEEIPEVTEES